MNNPALRQQSREERAPVIPVQQDASLLDWLEGQGRLLEREVDEENRLLEEDEEISELMEGEDRDFTPSEGLGASAEEMDDE